ncbi:Baeyer-Villiger monooxygenase [Fulvia fulva]|uniref:Baeyer-Villiger monooxygenase n=1 Tax=Passalora fulva TaxID=5499 RepID=A0A9Q8PA26_PASFU|nr:Baeyer-Villiger monooxygenase [Fulvia fulva]KAK4622112.1 Baeyer-Villiger monooxygenase [Fulvia fulva]KAK4623381.1 Baeyer-Villiger monooxygenase [Fulvia fulva]UJO18667.1 Baeyer-Villiger monooxygenase [Fulvia fulva]WPV16519.1 Baeyer-Villiger monooxygenase [Fulvia fulva]WPV30993.1 Baeyer-Villiger monooxygenase [Fulvia fulva]
MLSFEQPMFSRKLSFGTLVDLSEKNSLGQDAIRPRIAIVGAGITGVSTACHILDAGYECHIFEAGDEASVGGIWARVNDTSTLQIHSQFYRFHDAVSWQSDYPNRKEILGQVSSLWERYDLGSRTTFSCEVTSTYQEDDGKWVVNDPANGYFDGLVAAVGTCGEVYTPAMVGRECFKGQVLHSSELDRNAVKGKNVLIVGGGASAVEALEFACDNGAATAKVLARSERWFIPRHPTLNACLAATIGDKWGILSYILEFLLRLFFYKDLSAMAPPANFEGSLFSGTPIVNNRVFSLMRQGRASWVRGDVECFTPEGIQFSRRVGGAKKGTSGARVIEQGEVCILATGYTRPSLRFLPKSKSSAKYQKNWYLQCFPTDNPTMCATNCTWKDGIGSVGGCHIGVYTRFLLVFLLDPRTAPSEGMMKAWVGLVHILKKPCTGGALAFVTSAELFFWFLAVILLQPALWPWLSFILAGPGPDPDPRASQKAWRQAIDTAAPLVKAG